MKRLTYLFVACTLLLGLTALPARAHLEGIMNLASDDKVAVAQLGATARHVLVYFGDHAN